MVLLHLPLIQKNTIDDNSTSTFDVSKAVKFYSHSSKLDPNKEDDPCHRISVDEVDFENVEVVGV